MQEAFDWSTPAVDVSQVSPVGVPIQQHGSLRSRHSSSEGAKAVQPHAERQMCTVLDTYKTHGPLCDTEVELLTGIDRSSVIPRRRELEKRGLVIEVGFRKNPKSGRSNTAFNATGGQHG